MDEWEVLDLHHGSEVLAIHAALLRDGRVAYFSGSEHDAAQHNAGLIDHSRVWDPVTNVITKIPSPAHDLFCCGHGYLGDGRLLVAGGTKTYDYLGLKESTLFDAAALPHHDPWIAAPDMARGRWYPTLVTLSDGRVVAVSGALDQFGTGLPNIDVEVFTPEPPTGAWTVVGVQLEIPGGYPRMHVLPDGRVLSVTPMGDVCRAWSPVTLGWTDMAPSPGPQYQGWITTSVMLPLLPHDHHRVRIMVAGTAQPELLDFDALDQGWQPTAARALPGSPVRNHACAVLLPDATVAVVGGSTTDADADGVLAAEIFDPATGHWSAGASASVPRVYHNVALLLPDGRVWTAGSNHNGAQGHSEMRVEAYHPPYLFKGPRPTVAAAPPALRIPMGLPTSATFEIETPQASSIASAALLRCGSVTHAFDADQRYVGLHIVARSADRLVVARPPTTEIAPPGPYFLYVVDTNGVPSVGRPVAVQPITWSVPKAVPGWIGDMTADGDVAVADISGTGRPDLVVLHVDNPGGGNAGYYRLGWDLDAAGDPAGGWTDVKGVPGWFGDETAGAGVAVADISGTGRPDIVVLHVDNPGGGNAGYYRLGWDLDAAGDPAGGWTDVKGVPGWFGDETAGAGLTVADISGTGRPDIVVLHVDNPGGENHGYYRIGWDLNADGDPAGGWTAPKAVPGWFHAETAGGGIAVADISGSGRPDLVVFHVVVFEGGNHGFYRIGWDLDQAGDPTGGWTDVIGVPGWFGDQTEAAGLAVTDLNGNGRPDLVVFHVDAPDGPNAGYFRVLVT